MPAILDRGILGSTLGAQLLGNVASGILYGITCVQTYMYYNSDHKDSKPFMFLISFLWFVDSFHLAFVTHASYHLMVLNFDNLSGLSSARPVWSLFAQMYLNCITQIIIRLIFARRVWLLSKGNKYLAGTIIATSTFAFATGFAFTTMNYTSGDLPPFPKISYILYASLAGDVVTDILIAASLCISLASLARSRTGWKTRRSRANSLIDTLMIYTINTGLLTSLCATACLITYIAVPLGLIALAIYSALGKLYFNSLLGMLNARDTLREKNGGWTTEIMPDRSPIPSNASRDYPPIVARSFTFGTTHENYNGEVAVTGLGLATTAKSGVNVQLQMNDLFKGSGKL